MAAGSGGAPRNDSAPAMFGLRHASGRRDWSLLVFEPCGLRCQLDLERRTVAPAHVGNRELIMLLRNWFSTCVAVGFMSLAPHIASAKEVPATAQPDAAANSLPQACLDSGLQTQKECQDFLKGAGVKAKNNGAASNGTTAPATDSATKPSVATDAKPTPQPAVAQLAKECMTAGIKTKADCDSFLAAKGAASADKAKAPAGGVIPSPASSNAAAIATLPKDCVDAGLKLKADCDALHAANGQKVKGNPPTGSAQTTSPNPVANPAASSDVKVVKSPPTQAPAGAAPNDFAAQLAGAAKSFDTAATALHDAGQDKAATDKARVDLQTAQARIDELCKLNKSASTTECLRQYNIKLTQIEAAPADKGSNTAIASAPSQPVETIKTLPKGVTQDQVAPLLDSAKETKLGKGSVGQAAPAGAAATVSASATPPPKDDKAAQADIKVATVAPIDQAKGQPIVAPAGGQPPAPQQQVQVPKNVTIVNQTTINNSTTNTTNTTNVQNNAAASGGADNTGSRVPDVRNNGQAPAGNGTGGRPNNPIGLSFGLVLQLGNETFVNSPARDQYRIANRDRDHTDYERLPQNRYRETITRPDGVRVVTIYDQNGDILRRSRFDRDGHEIVLAYFDDSHDQELLQWRDPGDDLPPLRLNIPASDYVLDARQADAGQVERFFGQPPVERVERLYSISEVKRSARIRDMVRRLEIGDLTFDTGSASLSPDQFGALNSVADAMRQLLQQNPAETFLIEGHTDAVGSDASNLVLSDARAATVAGILSDSFQVPPENLATQGYGAHFLKVQTDGPEQLNRRVVVRRITPLVTVAASNQ